MLFGAKPQISISSSTATTVNTFESKNIPAKVHDHVETINIPAKNIDAFEHDNLHVKNFGALKIDNSIPHTENTVSNLKLDKIDSVPDFSNQSTQFEFSELSNDFYDTNNNISDLNVSTLNLNSTEDIQNSLFNQSINDYSLDQTEEFLLYLLDFAQPKSMSNSIFLFGKTIIKGKSMSCMCRVNDVWNEFWVFKNSEASFKDLYSELKEIFKINGILTFKCKNNAMRYPFDIAEGGDISTEIELLQVRCKNAHKLPDDLKGRTFYKVLNLRRSLCEYFIVNKKIKGPCWVSIKNYEKVETKMSHCAIEIAVQSTDSVKIVSDPPPPPLLNIASISIFVNGKAQSQSIVGVALSSTCGAKLDQKNDENAKISSAFIICPPSTKRAYPPNFMELVKKAGIGVEITSSPKSLLMLLFTKLNRLDPDVIVGHDLFEYTLKYLLHASQQHKIGVWSMIGRLKQSSVPKNPKMFEYSGPCVGRIIVDLKTISEELISLQSYDLNELCSKVLKITRKAEEYTDINNIFNQSMSLIKFIKQLMSDSQFCIKIMNQLNILPLFYQISQICGQPVTRALTLGRAERIEYLFLHSFTEADCICPDKIRKEHKSGLPQSGLDKDHEKRKAAYSGGLVLEPKVGYYPDFILLFDYMSLYPSLIQEFNVCFTTVKYDNIDGETSVNPVGSTQGVIPKEIKKLVERRYQVKQLLKAPNQSPSETVLLDIRQRALKLIANSIYGCLGYPFFRFSAKPLASFITLKGRELLGKTRDIVEALGFDVIYGDTDSIMVNTKVNDYAGLSEISSRIISTINKNYRCLKIELDGVFKPMLLFKKKKYAAVSITKMPDMSFSKKVELKGLDIIRHDWSIIAKESGEHILNLILGSDNHDSLIETIQEYLSQISDDIYNKNVKLEKLIVKKKITKNLNDYPENAQLGHVIVARRLAADGRKITIGDTIEYIVCIDGTSNSSTQRCYHISEVQQLKYDFDPKYYLETQLYPVISRLCCHISGFDASIIASSLKIASTVTNSTYSVKNTQSVDKLPIFCSKCVSSYDFEMFLTNHSSSNLRCLSCHSKLNFTKFFNYIHHFVHKTIRQYYTNQLICTNPDCPFEDNFVVTVASFKDKFACNCGKGFLKQKFSSAQLYEQLKYLHDVLNLDSIKNSYLTSPSLKFIEAFFKTVSADNYLRLNFDSLTTKMAFILKNSAYSNVNLAEIFSP